MCTPLTLARFVRWRIQNLALNVFACNIPPDDESDKPYIPTETMVFKGKKNKRVYLTDQEKSLDEICDNGELVPGSSSFNGTGLDYNEMDLSWPPFTDEDFIVFCFKEDGTLHIADNEKMEASEQLDCSIRRLRSVKRKLRYEDINMVNNHNHEPMSIKDGAEIDSKIGRASEIIDEKDEDEKNNYLNPESQDKENNDYGTISPESSASIQSDSSSGSFAFPVVTWEWTGSPTRMPTADKLHLRNHRAWNMGLHCCRF